MSEPTAEPQKKKRTLPEALRAHQFQKGHKRATKPASAPKTETPAATSQPTIAAANARAVTVRHTSVLGWLGL